jgi:hypothetical protein
MKALGTFLSAIALLVLSIFAGGGRTPAKSPRGVDVSRVSGAGAGEGRAVFQHVDLGASRTLKAAVLSATVVSGRDRMQLQAFLRALAISQMAGYRIAATPTVSSIIATGVAGNLGAGSGAQR